MICPRCCGSGEGQRHVERGGGRSHVIFDPCTQCHGTGEVVQDDVVLSLECLRCSDLVRLPSIIELSLAVRIANTTKRLPSGLVFFQGEGVVFDSRIRIYCKRCSANLRVCRICGWTEELDGVTERFFVEDRLCSTCRMERAA